MVGILKNQYAATRKKLDKMGYSEAFPVDALLLVEHLVNDLEISNDALNKLTLKSNKIKEITQEFQNGVEPFKEEILRLTEQNTKLKSEILKKQQNAEENIALSKSRLFDLESQNSDLKLLINHFVERLKVLEADSLRKTKKLALAHENNLEAIVVTSDGVKRQLSTRKQRMEINCSAVPLCPHCVRIRNFVEFGRDHSKEPGALDYLKIADSRIECLQILVQRCKREKEEMRKTIESLQQQSLNRGDDNGGDDGGHWKYLSKNTSSVSIVNKKGENSKDIEMSLRTAQLQLNILQKRNLDLEERLKKAILNDQHKFLKNRKMTKEVEDDILDDLVKACGGGYPSHEELTLEEKNKYLEAQLSHCCEEKAKLKYLLEQCEGRKHGPIPSPKKPKSQDVKKSKSNPTLSNTQSSRFVEVKGPSGSGTSGLGTSKSKNQKQTPTTRKISRESSSSGSGSKNGKPKHKSAQTNDNSEQIREAPPQGQNKRMDSRGEISGQPPHSSSAALDRDKKVGKTDETGMKLHSIPESQSTSTYRSQSGEASSREGEEPWRPGPPYVPSQTQRGGSREASGTGIPPPPPSIPESTYREQRERIGSREEVMGQASQAIPVSIYPGESQGEERRKEASGKEPPPSIPESSYRDQRERIGSREEIMGQVSQRIPVSTYPGESQSQGEGRREEASRVAPPPSIPESSHRDQRERIGSREEVMGQASQKIPGESQGERRREEASRVAPPHSIPESTYREQRERVGSREEVTGQASQRIPVSTYPGESQREERIKEASGKEPPPSIPESSYRDQKERVGSREEVMGQASQRIPVSTYPGESQSQGEGRREEASRIAPPPSVPESSYRDQRERAGSREERSGVSILESISGLKIPNTGQKGGVREESRPRPPSIPTSTYRDNRNELSRQRPPSIPGSAYQGQRGSGREETPGMIPLSRPILVNRGQSQRVSSRDEVNRSNSPILESIYVRGQRSREEILRHELEAAKADRDELRLKLRSVTSVTALSELDRQNIKEELERRNKEIDNLRSQIQKYISEVRKWEEILADKEEENEQILQQYKALRNEYSELEIVHSSLERESDTVRQTTQAAVEQNATLKTQLTRQSSLAKSFEEQIGRLSAQVTALETKLKSTTETGRAYEIDSATLREDYLSMEKKMDSLRLELANCESHRKRLEAENRDLYKRIEELQETVLLQNEDIKKLENVIGTLRETKEIQEQKLQAQSAEKDYLETQAITLSTRNDQLHHELAHVRLRCTEAMNELERIQRQLMNEKVGKEAAVKELENLQRHLTSSSAMSTAHWSHRGSRSPTPSGSSAEGTPTNPPLQSSTARIEKKPQDKK